MRLLEDYPSSAQPATIADLKHMLLSVKECLHRDMTAMLTNVTSAVQYLSLRMSHAEDYMGDIYNAHNNVIDIYNDHEEEIKRISRRPLTPP